MRITLDRLLGGNMMTALSPNLLRNNLPALVYL